MVLAHAVRLESNVHEYRHAAPGKKPASRVDLRLGLMILGGCLLLFAVNAFLNGLVTAGSARVAALAQEYKEAEDAGRDVELEIEYLSSYPRIAHEAETRLAMHPAGLDELRYVPQPSQAGPQEPPVVAERPRVAQSGLRGTVTAWLQGLGRALASTR